MEICILLKYKIDWECSYCTESFDCDDWVEESFQKTEVMTGQEFISWIRDLMSNSEFYTFACSPGEIVIDYFDPMTGKSTTYKIKFKALEEKLK